MASFSPQEIHFCEDGQTLIELSNPYVVNAHELMVFLNGMLAICGEDKDYIEIDEYHIRFNYQLSSDDIVVTQHQVYFDDKKISVIGSKGDSLFQIYGDTDALLKNQEYIFTLKHGEQTFTHTFYTKLEPAYSTVPVIRNDLGEVISSIRDIRILFLILQNSILAQNIASEENLNLLESESKTPYVFKQYVRYQTEVDLMTSIYLTLSGRSGMEQKVLGELEIIKQYRLDYIKPLLDELKLKLRQWERELRGLRGSSPVRTAVRGATNYPYPLTTPRRTNTTTFNTSGGS